MTKDIKMTITQYDKYADKELNIYTDTLENILNMIGNYEEYYYGITAFGRVSSKKVKDTYFGVTTSSVGGLKLTEANYLNNRLNHIIKLYKKYKDFIPFDFGDIVGSDILFLERIGKFSKNTEEGFQEAINLFLDENWWLKKITDLNNLTEKSGLYFLILDEYNVCYVGQAQDMKKRIMRHWSRNDYFYGSGVDLFKAKDTTRIYAYPMNEKTYNEVDMFEYVFIESIPEQYRLNLVPGGKMDFLCENRLPLTFKEIKPFNEMTSEDFRAEAQKRKEDAIQWEKKMNQNMNKFIVQ